MGHLEWAQQGAGRRRPQGSPLTRPLAQGPSRSLLLNGKPHPTKVRLLRGGSLPPVKRRRMNWIDAPDDVFYMATEETRWGLRPGMGVGRGRPCPRHLGATLHSQENPQAALILGDQASCPPALQAHRPAPEPGPAAAATPACAGQRRAHSHRGLGPPLPQAAPTTDQPPPTHPSACPPGFGSALPPPPAEKLLLGPRAGRSAVNLFRESPGAVFSFVLLFWPERSEEPPSDRTALRAPGPAGSFVVFR